MNTPQGHGRAVMADRVQTRRRQAEELADQLLADIELGQADGMSIARKASRLARLLDDSAAMVWLAFEVTGYPKPLDADASRAARRSCRHFTDAEGVVKVHTTMLGQLAAEVAAAETDLAAGSGDTSDSQYAVAVESHKAQRRANLRSVITARRGVADKVVGAIYEYVAEKHQELRFGSSVETAFEHVRAEVDAKIGALVPDALPMVSAAFENAASENPEHWQAAAATCRRLLMTAADKLRPPGPDVNDRKMGQGNYVNRLVDWIVQQGEGETARRMIASDLEYLGPRLDAADGAGQKGAHVGEKPVSRLDASRFITGTYLVLGDILAVQGTSDTT